MKRRNLKKKIGSLLLATAMIVTSFPALSSEVYAEGGAAARSTHSHDMSVECGNDAPLDYIPLTGDADGKLYINGAEATTGTSGSSAGDYILPEGNYYLAENITVHQGVVIPQEKTVNLCLNGKTLQIQTETEQERERIQIEEQGTFCLSDCEGGGRITSGFYVLEPSSQGKFIMYGGCLESTMTAGTVIFMTNSNASAEIYGGTIKSDKGVGIASDEWTQCELHLSGNPVFEGNMVDVNPHVTLYLDALDRNRNERIKVSRKIELSVGESQSLDSICSSDGVDYSTVLAGRAGQYFTYKNDEYFVNRAGVTRQPTPEEVSVDVLPAEGAAYQWYEAAEQDVTADRTIENMSGGGMSATMFTLQAGDMLYFTLPETPTTSEDGGDAVMLYTMEQDMIFVTSLGNRRYKGTVESDVTFMIVYETESSSFNVGLFEEGTYEVRAVTQGDAVVGQTTDTFTKVESGVYLCKITWENLGCDVNSDIVELTFTDAEKVADAKSVVEKALAGIMVTNGTTKENIQSVIDTALTKAGINGVAVTVGALDKTEATTSMAGSISGNVTIKCGNVTESVAVNKSIGKLQKTDAEKVAEAKKAVEEALAGYTAANDTTKEKIQNLIDMALTEAGITDVTATVGDLSKTEATTSVAGSVSGNVTIKCGNVTDSVAINKSIGKLPEDTKQPENSIITSEQREKNNITIMAGAKVSQTGKKISISWGKVKGADGYQVYVAYCGKKFTVKPAKTVKSASVTKVSVEKINGKKLNLKKNYKVYIAAYKTVNGKKVVIGKTLVCHIVGKNNKAYTNVKQIKLAKSKFTLKKGKTAKIKAKAVLVDKKKKQLSNAHAQEFRYVTSNKKVATVSKKGKIKAVGKGSCIIYVYARNGYAKKIKVKVK